MTPLAPLVTTFFRKNLTADKGVSKNTLASYSYTFKFLCRYVSGRLGKTPSNLSLEDLDAGMIRDFLEHRECDCGNTPRTRNLRLTAIRSFMKYVEYEVPWRWSRSVVSERFLEQADARAAGESLDPGGDESGARCSRSQHARRSP